VIKVDLSLKRHHSTGTNAPDLRIQERWVEALMAV